MVWSTNLSVLHSSIRLVLPNPIPSQNNPLLLPHDPSRNIVSLPCPRSHSRNTTKSNKHPPKNLVFFSSSSRCKSLTSTLPPFPFPSPHPSLPSPPLPTPPLSALSTAQDEVGVPYHGIPCDSTGCDLHCVWDRDAACVASQDGGLAGVY